jgi:hypothetical protein
VLGVLGQPSTMLPCLIANLSCLAAFNSSFGPRSFAPTQLDVPNLVSRRLSHTAGSPEPPINERDPTYHVIHFENHPFSAAGLANRDIEESASRSSSSQPAQGLSAFPLVDALNQAVPIVSPQPVRVFSQAMIGFDVSPAVVQLETEYHHRRGKILSYSNPIWEALSTPEQDIPVPVVPQLSVAIARSPTPSSEHGRRTSGVASHGSTILGSDIIQGTSSCHGRDPMRVHRPGPTSKFLSTSSIPSCSQRWVAGQSWESRLSVYPQVVEEVTFGSRSMMPEERVQSVRSISSRSSKSKRQSKSRRSSVSRKSSNSLHLAKPVTAARSPSRTAHGSVASSRHSTSFPGTARRGTVGYVRGPRPPPLSPRIRQEGSQELDQDGWLLTHIHTQVTS